VAAEAEHAAVVAVEEDLERGLRPAADSFDEPFV